ncbi:MAG: tetratricopeptide repeat protein, partial [Rhodospirillales bacterium]|nr:tetratricopeptide repeat protein [Rhodospirillales bacterium]
MAIRLHPGSGRLYVERGDALSCLGRYEEAIADYDRAIGLDADNAAAYFKRCLARSELGLHVEAIEDYD